MYLDRIKISDVRGFHGVRSAEVVFGERSQVQADRRYPGLTVIAGRNGSGKSSFLRAIAAALSGPDVTYLLTETDREWVSQGHQRGSVEIDVVATDEHRRPDPISVGLTWRPARGGRNRPQADLSLRGRRERSPAEPEMWSPQPAGWFCAGYGPFRRLAGTAGEVTRLMAGDHAVARFVTLFREEASLAETVQWLQQVDYRARSRQPGYSALDTKVLALLNDGLLPDGHRADRVDPDGLWLSDSHGVALRVDEMSDGYRSVTALVTDIVRQIHDCFGGAVAWDPGTAPRVTAPGIVLIDEIDAHLHVTWQKAIGPWLREHFPRIQFIVTTHSPYVCQSASPGGLIKLPGPTQDYGPHVVDDELYRRVVYGTGDDGVLTELFGLDSPYSTHADALRHRLTALETLALRGRADDRQLAELTTLAERITPSPSSRIRDTFGDS